MIMTTIAPGHWLDSPAAAAYFRMIAAGCPTGGISEAGRTRARQTYIYVTWLAQRFWPIKRREFKAFAAKPGTSKHEKGNALDLKGAALAWVRAHGAPFGFRKDLVRGEVWHVEYQDTTDEHAAEAVGNVIATPGNPTGAIPTAFPTPIVPQEDIVASLADLTNALAPLKAAIGQVAQRVDADRKIGAAYRLTGGTAVWLVHPSDVGREHLTGEVYDAAGKPRILNVPATSSLWALPILGPSLGELYRKTADPSGAAYQLTDGHLRHIDATEYATAGKPLIVDLPTTHPLWTLPLIGA